jgi:hypothetical protein
LSPYGGGYENAASEPRPTLGPLILTLLIVAGIVGVLALTISGITH